MSWMKCRMITIHSFLNFLNTSFLDQNSLMKWLPRTIWVNDEHTSWGLAECNIVSITRSFKNWYMYAKGFSALMIFMIQNQYVYLIFFWLLPIISDIFSGDFSFRKICNFLGEIKIQAWFLPSKRIKVSR